MSGTKNMQYEEVSPKVKSGMAVLLINTAAIIIGCVGFIFGIILLEKQSNTLIGILLVVVGSVHGFLIGPVLYAGLKILKPNEALVLTLFGRYYGTLKGEGFFYVNPFVTAVNPAASTVATTTASIEQPLPTDRKSVV